MHELCNLRYFVDDLFVFDLPSFQDFMYIYASSFGCGINPKEFCEIICSYKSDCYTFLDLEVFKIPICLKVDIYNKHLEPDYASLMIIRKPYFSFNISNSEKYGVICSQLF